MRTSTERVAAVVLRAGLGLLLALAPAAGIHGCRVDLSSSIDHCGFCDAPCTGDASCVMGYCQ